VTRPMAALMAAVLLVVASAASAQTVALWGTVVWSSGAPAGGIELRLVRKGSVLPEKIYTNSAGRFGLSRVSPPTTNYAVQVLRRGSVVKTVNLPPLRNGDRIPNIVMP
jgi:hypothetical protein